MLGADVDVLVKEDNVFQGISFQDEGMKQVFASYPELLCSDATYKLLELRCPLYIMLVEDGNGQSEVAAAFLLVEENEQSLSCVIENFKQKNPQWEHTRVLMADKDMTEREVLSTKFPNAQLLICLFHTLRSFRREISTEKLGITSGQRSLCLELLQQMAYAQSEEIYLDLYAQFQKSAPATVLEYFDANWHAIRKQWTMGMKYSTGNFLNNTNNRLESLNSKLKSVISRYSSLEEFVDNFYLVLQVLRSERDHKASLTVQKVPVTFHSISDSSSIEYMTYLTPYAYKFIAKQMSLFPKVSLTEIGSDDFNVTTSAGCLQVNGTSCQCVDWKSMHLPCRHILAARACLGLPLFDEELCDKRWSMEYYKSSQRVFVPTQEVDHDMSVISFAAPKKKTLSQVHIYWMIFMNDFGHTVEPQSYEPRSYKLTG